jgi:hypothetical protein
MVSRYVINAAIRLTPPRQLQRIRFCIATQIRIGFWNFLLLANSLSAAGRNTVGASDAFGD